MPDAPNYRQRDAERLVAALAESIHNALEDAESTALDCYWHTTPDACPDARVPANHLAAVGGLVGLRGELQRVLKMIDVVEATAPQLR